MDFIIRYSMPVTTVTSDVIVTLDMLWLDSGYVNLNVVIYRKLLDLWGTGSTVHMNGLCCCGQAVLGKPRYLHMVPVQNTSKSTENGHAAKCGYLRSQRWRLEENNLEISLDYVVRSISKIKKGMYMYEISWLNQIWPKELQQSFSALCVGSRECQNLNATASPTQ